MIEIPIILAATSPSSTDEPTVFENVLLTVAAVIGGIWFLKRKFADWERKSAAVGKARGLTHMERDAVERQILELLHLAPDHTLQVRELSDMLGEHSAFVDCVLGPLIKWGSVEIVTLPDDLPDANFNEYSRISLTSEGDRRLREKDPAVHYHGEYFHVGDNSTGINRSSIIGSNIAAFQHLYDPETIAALRKIETLVKEGGDPDAIDAVEGFLAEAHSDNPSKSRMRLLFNGVKQAVPLVTGAADAVAKVSQIFS
ncbi:hypothetical protein ACWKSP_29505 [Micromonosporaceae bacterium Da 78-11]